MHHHHALRSKHWGRLRFIARRLVRSVIGYLVAIICISAVINTTMEATIRSQITEMVMGATMSNSDLKTAEDVIAFKADVTRSLERSFGLHLPSWVRVLRRSWQVITLDLGNSRSTTTGYPERSRSVSKIIKERTPPTVILFSASTLVSIALGLWLGTRMAAKPGGHLDRSATVMTMLMYGTPSWWLGTFFILFFVYSIPVFKIGALHSVGVVPGTLHYVLDYLAYMALPFLTLVAIKVWSIAYMTRTMVIVPMQEDYTIAARGRGIPERKILAKHGLGTAAPGVLTTAAQAFAQSIGGDILLERVMTRPGLGTTLFSALLMNDVNLVTAIMAMLTAIYCITYALLDIAYGVLDPRIAYSQ